MVVTPDRPRAMPNLSPAGEGARGEEVLWRGAT